MEEGFYPNVGIKVSSRPRISSQRMRMISSTSQQRRVFDEVFDISTTFSHTTRRFSILLPRQGQFSQDGPSLYLSGVGTYRRFNCNVFGLGSNVRFRGVRSIVLIRRGLSHSNVSMISHVSHAGHGLTGLFSLLKHGREA